jgi:hypothetical protein
VRRRVAETIERVTTSTNEARRHLPDQIQAAPTIDGISTIIDEMSEMLRRAAAESA